MVSLMLWFPSYTCLMCMTSQLDLTGNVNKNTFVWAFHQSGFLHGVPRLPKKVIQEVQAEAARIIMCQAWKSQNIILTSLFCSNKSLILVHIHLDRNYNQYFCWKIIRVCGYLSSTIHGASQTRFSPTGFSISFDLPQLQIQDTLNNYLTKYIKCIQRSF